MTDPADWTREQAQAAQAELDELERTDPGVAAAAASYDRMVERVIGRTTTAGHTDAGTWLAEWWPYVRIADYKALTGALGSLLNDQQETIHDQYVAEIRAADHLSFVVTSYMLGDLDGADVAEAQQAYRQARHGGDVPF